MDRAGRRRRGLGALPLTLVLACTAAVPETESGSGRGLEAEERQVGGCVWIDFDGTLNTVGAFGWPLNPVPAAELCELLAERGDELRATPLTARSGCWPSFQPGERACRGLEPTISVPCSRGAEAASHKEQEMRAHDAACAWHVLIDDNEAAADIEGGDPAIDHVLPIPWAWEETRAEILAAIEGR